MQHRPALRRRGRRGHAPSSPSRAPRRATLGVAEVWVDPGIGFGKTVAHNLALLRHLAAARRRSAARCWSGPAARPSSGGSSPRPTAATRRPADRRPPRGLPRHRGVGAWSTAPRWSACTTSPRPWPPVGRCCRRLRRGSRRDPSHRQRGDGWPCRPRRQGDRPMAVKGKWAQGIAPRNFAWIIKDQLAVSRASGRLRPNHRRVRRQEEIIWMREQGFTCVISLIPSPHNLHNYDELGVTWRHRPFGVHDDNGECARAPSTPSCASCWPTVRRCCCTARSSATACAASSPATCCGRARRRRAAGDHGHRAIVERQLGPSAASSVADWPPGAPRRAPTPHDRRAADRIELRGLRARRDLRRAARGA